MGCAEGQSPFAGSLRVSLRYNFFSFLYRKESEEGQEEFFRSSGEDISKSEQLRIDRRGTYVLGSLVQASLVDTPKDRGDRMTRALTTRTAPGRALPPHDPHGPSLTHGSRAGVGAGLKPALPVAVASRRLHAPLEEPALSLPKGVSHSVSFVSHSASLVSYSASVVSRTVSQAKAERDTMRQDKTHIGDFFPR